MALKIVACPNCNARVAVRADGTCPSCQAEIDSSRTPESDSDGSLQNSDLVIRGTFFAPQLAHFRPVHLEGDGELKALDDRLIVSGRRGSKAAVRVLVYGYLSALVIGPVIASRTGIPAQWLMGGIFLAATGLAALVRSMHSGGRRVELEFPLDTFKRFEARPKPGTMILHFKKQAVCFRPRRGSADEVRLKQFISKATGK